MFVTFQLHFSSYSEVCLYAVLTFIFLGPDLTFYNYEIGPKSDPESRCELLYPPLGGPLGDHSGSGRNPEKSGSSEGSKMKIHDVFRALPRNRTISSVAKTEKTSRHGDFKFIFASCRGVFVTFKLHFSVHFEVCLSPSNFILPHI